MTNQTKLIIVGAIIAAALVYYFGFYKKSGALTDMVDPNDPFSIDDTNAYKGVRGLIPANDHPWVDPFVETLYKSKGTTIILGGKPSKTLAFMEIAGRVNPNEKTGTFTDKNGAKVLWPQETFDKMWTEFRNPLMSKYGGL